MIFLAEYDLGTYNHLRSVLTLGLSKNLPASAARLSRAAARGILRISKMRFLRRGTSCVGSFYYLCADREKIWPRSLAE